jgi:hypothetical protein
MDITHALYSLPCALAPDGEVAPMGFGLSFSSGDVCKGIADRVLTGAKFINNQVSIENSLQWAKDDTADCNSLQNFYARTFCDLHCLRDTVKTGDKAILKSLEGAGFWPNSYFSIDYFCCKQLFACCCFNFDSLVSPEPWGAVDVMGKNTDALLEHYSENLQDSINGLKETTGSSLLEDAQTMKLGCS